METIKYYHKNIDVIAYEKTINDKGYWSEKTYDEKGNLLTFKDSEGYWTKRTYDEKGNLLTYKNSEGYWFERTYDEKGNELTFKDSDGYWEEITYDEKGNQLIFKNSEEVFRVKNKNVTKEEFEAFTNPLVSKITE